MQLDINLPVEQVALLAEKLGYKARIEDITQPLEGDSHPLIDNPVTLEQFTSVAITKVLLDKVQNSLREQIQIVMTNILNQATEKVAKGDYDNDLMTLPTQVVLGKIISELTT